MTNLPPPAEPAAGLKSRILAAVHAEPTPTRPALRRRNVALLAAGAVVALAIFAACGGMHVHGRPWLLVAATCLGWIAAAAVALPIAFARGRSMLGRPTAWLVTLIVGTPLVLLAWKVAVTSPFGSQRMARSIGHPGLHCLELSLGIGATLLASFVAARRRTDPVRPGIAGAALGSAAGIAAGILVDLWCPIAHVPHLLFGHILPLVLLAAIGAVAGRRFLRV